MKYIPLVLFVLLISSCGKKNQIKVTAKNAATGEGYADLGFRIFEVKPYTTPTGEVQELVYEGNFNANGEAVADIRLKNRSYVIKRNKSRKFVSSEVISKPRKRYCQPRCGR